MVVLAEYGDLDSRMTEVAQNQAGTAKAVATRPKSAVWLLWSLPVSSPPLEKDLPSLPLAECIRGGVGQIG